MNDPNEFARRLPLGPRKLRKVCAARISIAEIRHQTTNRLTELETRIRSVCSRANCLEAQRRVGGGGSGHGDDDQVKVESAPSG